jgi:PAS domain S-box-containing protein
VKAHDENEKYRGFFEHSAVPMWEEDITRLRSRIRTVKASGRCTLREYIGAHPEFVQEAAGLIKVADVNQASLRLFEADRKDQLLGPLNIVLDRVSQEAFTATIVAMDEGKTEIESESTARTLKGKWLSLIVKTRIPPADAAHPSMLVSIIDITARKEAEDRYRELLEQAADGIFVTDETGRFVIVNAALCDMLGYERQALLAMNVLDTYPHDDRPLGSQRLDQIRAGEALRFERRAVKRDGSLTYMEVSVRRLESGGMQAIMNDIAARRRIEQELAHERSLFNTLMQNLPDYIYFKDEASRFVHINRSHARALGLTDPSEAIGKTDADFYGPDHALKALKDEQRILAAGAPMEDIEERESYPNRPDTWAITTKMPLRDAQGRIIGTFGITHDITERKKMEAALAWERGLFDLLMENLPDRIYFKNAEGRFIRTSRSHAAERGLTDPAQEIGKTDADFSDSGHSQKALDDERRIMGTGEPIVDLEEKVILPNRPATWFLTTKMPLRDPAGAVVGTFGISHDITVRKLLEAKNQHLATLVESVEDAIVGMDLERRITIWNRGAERLYGYSTAEMIGAVTSTLIPPELEGEARLIRERLARGEQISHFETARLRKDGSRIDVSLTMSAIFDKGGKIAGMASVARDITEQKALLAQLNRAQRLESLATLAGGVAHQFNNINTVVKGYLDLMDTEELPDRLATFVQAASAGVRRAVAITDRLLALTEPGGTAGSLRLDALVQSLLPNHETRIKDETVRLALDLAETPPVRGDEVRLRFVFSSLIENALDSLLDRPVKTVRVSTGCIKDACYFEVEDTGCGIPEEDLPRIFSPFFSRKGEWAPPDSPQARLKGVGLSLAISSMTVSEYGGRIDVQSTEGAGSTFRIVLPLNPPDR